MQQKRKFHMNFTVTIKKSIIQPEKEDNISISTSPFCVPRIRQKDLKCTL